MNDVALTIAVLFGGLIVGLLVLVATGTISTKTYLTIAYSGITVVLALATLVSLSFAALYFIDVVFLAKLGHSAWSIVVMLFFAGDPLGGDPAQERSSHLGSDHSAKHAHQVDFNGDWGAVPNRDILFGRMHLRKDAAPKFV
jgi:hypothetical protein